MSEAIRHVRELADRIGPRPATTDAEAQAADYIEDVFRSRGLEVERQEFDCPRTYAWAYVCYHLLTIASVGALFWADVWAPLRWVALGIAAFSAVAMWFDLDTRFGLSALMPKGPSQNIIARRIPKMRRGERARRVVIVAHYDSAKASLAFAPRLVKNFEATFNLMKWCTFLVPFVIFIDNLPLTSVVDPYLWYVALAMAAYLFVPLFINVHRELAMSATDGANDNASGVAALLGVVEAIVPEPEAGVQMSTQPLQRVAVESSGLPDDFEWAESKPVVPVEPPRQASLDFGTIEFEAVGVTRARSPEAPIIEEELFDFETATPTAGDLTAEDRASAVSEQIVGRAGRRTLFRWGKERREPRDGGLSSWLGVSKDFDARRAGRDIGNWDNFEDDEDDDFGSLGGWAGDDPIEDPDFPANEAARIRRRVAERVDRDIAEKEIWFVATGAEEAGTWGMRAFLDANREELKDAFIINIDNIGAGALSWVTREGMARRYASDRRLMNVARQVSREGEMVVKGREYKGLSTDATPALARGFRAMSVMAFDINGRLPNWHWYTDTSDNVRPENIDLAIQFVVGITKEL